MEEMTELSVKDGISPAITKVNYKNSTEAHRRVT